MRKAIFAVVTVVLCMCALSASAQKFEQGGFTFEINGTYVFSDEQQLYAGYVDKEDESSLVIFDIDTINVYDRTKEREVEEDITKTIDVLLLRAYVGEHEGFIYTEEVMVGQIPCMICCEETNTLYEFYLIAFYDKHFLKIDLVSIKNEMLDGLLMMKSISETLTYSEKLHEEVVLFGAYEQNNNMRDGMEPIEWIVIDKSDNQLLLLSKYVLDAYDYNEGNDGNVTWETSSIREWLNDEFLETAFTRSEQKYIQPVKQSTKDNNFTSAYTDTIDRVFLLTEQDISSMSDMELLTIPTAYADKAKSVSTDDDSFRTCWWWLRTPSWSAHTGCCVTSGGSFFSGLDTLRPSTIGVRPAIWVSADAVADQLTTVQSTSTIEKVGFTAHSTATPSPIPSATPTPTPVSGIRPEIKDIIDSYEAFMNEYYSFMKNLDDDNSLASLTQYAAILARYTSMMQQINNLNNSDLSKEELMYLNEAEARILQMLSQLE